MPLLGEAFPDHPVLTYPSPKSVQLPIGFPHSPNWIARPECRDVICLVYCYTSSAFINYHLAPSRCAVKTLNEGSKITARWLKTRACPNLANGGEDDQNGECILGPW